MKNVTIKVFDLAGQERMRNVWKYFYSSIEGIIFVCDASDPERSGEAREELHKLLSDEEAGQMPCLVFANKQDLPGALCGEEFAKLMEVGHFVDRGRVRVQECSAVKD